MSEQRLSEQRLSELLDPALQRMGVRERVRETQLQALFARAVGPAMAPMCRAQRLSRGALTVATAHTALAHQLQMEAPRIIAALNDGLGQTAVRRLRFAPMEEPPAERR